MAFLPTTPDHGTAATEKLDPLPHEDLMVPAADRIEAEVSVVIDVGHHHTDLVDVSREHDPGPAVRIDRRERVSAHVLLYRIGELFRFGAPERGRGPIRKPRARGVEQRLQERRVIRGSWSRKSSSAGRDRARDILLRESDSDDREEWG